MEASPTVWHVTTEDVSALVEAILNPTRLHSLALVSPAGDTGQPRIDVDALVDSVRNLPPDVVVLESMAASERLSDSISEAFHCYGGSVRVVMPQARVTDHFRRHPLLLIYPTDDPKVSLRRVVEAAERTPVRMSEPPAPHPEPKTGPALPVDPSRPIPKPGPFKPHPAPQLETADDPAPVATTPADETVLDAPATPEGCVHHLRCWAGLPPGWRTVGR